jgi:uncharacterized glyoxalase superfamily metalloenzyme YdcJ
MRLIESWELRARFANALSRMYGAEVPAYNTLVDHLKPRVLDIDEPYRRMSDRGIATFDAIQGPPHWDRPDVLLRQKPFRALAEPRWFRLRDGSLSHGALRVRFGEVECRGVALTPKGRQRYDNAMAAADVAASTGLPWQAAAESVWPKYFPVSDVGLVADELAYYHHSDPSRPIVYEDFLPRSAAGIFRSNLDDEVPAAGDRADTDYSLEWMAGEIGHHIHDPYALYEKAAR